MVSEKQFRTGAWYGDQSFTLSFPSQWDVTVYWPQTPAPLTDDQIVEALERPVGQPPIRLLCQGRSRPLVVVDDLTRPTPAARVMPFLLRHFRDAGIAPESVRILVATGTHGAPPLDALRKKTGPELANQLLVHDPNRNVVTIGKTSFGTPVTVNKEVAASDFVVGIGGIYPNHTAGFGGGSKLALGTLGMGSIVHLHYGHKSVGWASCGADSCFRKDLDEIARMIRLNTVISLHVNVDREPVRISCGNHLLFHKDAVAFARQTFAAPMPGDADVVISNAYPIDLSLTFVRLKGTTPLRHCGPGISRIAIGSCSEGLGRHALFPFGRKPRFHRQRSMARRISVMSPREVAEKAALRFGRALRFSSHGNGRRGDTSKFGPTSYPIWLYRPGNQPVPLPSQIGEIRITALWSEILHAIRSEQGDKERVTVLVYPCAPLQCLERSAKADTDLSRQHQTKDADCEPDHALDVE